jgi:hypothetical protein
MSIPTLLKATIADCRYSNPSLSEILELLCSEEKGAIKIRDWFKRHARAGVSALGRHLDSGQEVTCEDWEFEIRQLAGVMTTDSNLSDWDKAEYKKRSRYLEHVSRLAHQLADALEQDPNPGFPAALALFDNDCATHLAKAMGEPTLKYVSGEGCVAPPSTQWDPPSRLSHFFDYPEAQYLPSMLRRLAKYSDHPLRLRRPDSRPGTGEPSTRMLARKISNHFVRTYGHPWDEIVATCVALRCPQFEPAPTWETIRDWRGK